MKKMVKVAMLAIIALLTFGTALAEPTSSEMSQAVLAMPIIMVGMFDSFKRGEVKRDYQLLDNGQHVVSITEIEMSDDRHVGARDGREKAADKLPPWKDVLRQLIVQFVQKDENGKIIGTIRHRYNERGFVRFDELPEDQREGHFAAGEEGYAVNEKTGMRIEDPVRTAQCENILNELLAAARVPVGGHFTDAIGKTLKITVYRENYNGKEVPKVKAPTAIVEAPADVLPVADEKPM